MTKPLEYKFLIVLDFMQSCVIKIAFDDEDFEMWNDCDDNEEFVDMIADKYHFSYSNSQWMFLKNLTETLYNIM